MAVLNPQSLWHGLDPGRYSRNCIVTTGDSWDLPVPGPEPMFARYLHPGTHCRDSRDLACLVGVRRWALGTSWGGGGGRLLTLRLTEEVVPAHPGVWDSDLPGFSFISGSLAAACRQEAPGRGERSSLHLSPASEPDLEAGRLALEASSRYSARSAAQRPWTCREEGPGQAGGSLHGVLGFCFMRLPLWSPSKVHIGAAAGRRPRPGQLQRASHSGQ